MHPCALKRAEGNIEVSSISHRSRTGLYRDDRQSNYDEVLSLLEVLTQCVATILLVDDIFLIYKCACMPQQQSSRYPVPTWSDLGLFVMQVRDVSVFLHHSFIYQPNQPTGLYN